MSFTLKKQGEVANDVRTTEGASIIDNIRVLYGNAIATELLEVQI